MTKKYFIGLLISGLLISQSSFASESIESLSDLTQTVSDDSTKPDSALQLANKVSILLNDLLSLINNITSRIDSLSIEKQIKKSNTDKLLSIQAKLLRIAKNLPSFAQDKEKLTQLLEHLMQVSKGLERGLQESFTAPLIFTQEAAQTRSYKRMIQDTVSSSLEKFSNFFSTASDKMRKAANLLPNPFSKKEAVTPETNDPVEKLFLETYSYLAKSDLLMQNLGKTWINKTYARVTGWWNTPLFHIAPLGNTPVTPGSIGKRVALYGCNTVLIIYNLNQKYIDTIPFDGLKNFLTLIKTTLGQNTTPVESVRGSTEKQDTDGDSYILVSHDSRNSSINTPFGLSADRYPTLASSSTGAVAIEELNGKYHVIDAELGKCIETFDSQEEALSRIRYVGKQYEYNNRIITETRNPETGEKMWFTSRHVSGPFSHIENVTEDDVEEYRTKPISAQKAVMRFVGKDGKDVLPHIVLDDAASGNGGEKYNESKIGSTIFNKMWASISWFVEPELTPKFTLPIAGWLSSYIYEDMAEIKHNIPNITNWIHGKLSGTKPILEAHFVPPTKTFANVVGRDSIKERLMPYVKFVENPKLALQAGIQVPRGIIFAGEPQTGKTLMAEAFLGELSQAAQKQGRTFRMIEAKVNTLVSTGFKTYIEYMKQYAPCLIFCDEFELTGAERDQNRNLLAEFLTAISGVNGSGEDDIDKMVFFLVATNHPEKIDHALQEPGRLGTHIYFETPTAQEREQFFIHSLNKRHISLDNLDIDDFVQQTMACSFGKLNDIVGLVISQAQNKKEPVSQHHIDAALDEKVRRIVIDEYDIPTEQRVALAARYGAQAFTSLILNPNKKFVAATIYKITPIFTDPIVAKNYAFLERNFATENKKVAQANDSQASMIYGGFFSYNTHDTFGLVSHDEKLKLCKISLAGTVGQQVLGLPHMDFDSDMLLAYQYAHEIVFNGAREEWLSEKQRDAKRDEVWQLIQECKAEVKALLEANKEDYRKIVELLQRRYIIRTSYIKECFKLTSIDLSSYFTRLISDHK